MLVRGADDIVLF